MIRAIRFAGDDFVRQVRDKKREFSFLKQENSCLIRRNKCPKRSYLTDGHGDRLGIHARSWTIYICCRRRAVCSRVQPNFASRTRSDKCHVDNDYWRCNDACRRMPCGDCDGYRIFDAGGLGRRFGRCSYYKLCIRHLPIEELNDACFIVSDANGQKVAYVYFEEESGRRSAAKLLHPA